MASPQKENGFTSIANEILEHLCQPGINGSEYRVLLLVIRKTYGFQKKKDAISLSQFEKFTLMKRAQAVETIKSLLEKNILLKEDGKFVFNKNYEQWGVGKRLPPEGGRQKPTGGVGKSLPKGVGKSLPTKEKKEIYTKETPGKLQINSEEWKQLIDGFEAVNPFFTEFYRNTTERKALQALVEKFGFEKVLNTIQALPGIVSKQYAPKITTPYELKRDLGKLVLFMKQEESKTISKQTIIEEF